MIAAVCSRRRSGACVAVLIAALLGCSAAAAESLRTVGSVAALPRGAHLLGAVPALTRLRATVALAPRDPAGLQALASAVSTPGSGEYGRFLTVAEFAARYGPSRSAIGALERELRGAGLRIVTVPANHLSVEVAGSAGALERAFAVHLDRVQLARRVAYANTSPPALPAKIARSVQGVIGLNDLIINQPQTLLRPRPDARSPRAARPQGLATGGPQPCGDATGASASQPGYTFDQLASIYGFSSFYAAGDLGQGQTIGLFEQVPYQPSDIATFQDCYATSGSVTQFNVDGGPGTYTAYDPNLGDDSEPALDVDVVAGLAPRASVIVYQGPIDAPPTDILGAMVADDKAKVLSSSWGLCEALTDQYEPGVISAENTLLQEAATQGQSFFGSSGDSGSLMCFQATGQTSQPDYALSVIDPGAQPFATGVGGTYLGSPSGALSTGGAYPGEQVWNDGMYPDGSGGTVASGSGGGVSDQWPMPSYQSGAAASLGVVNANSSRTCAGQLCREVPDISADADPNSGYIVYANGNTSYGGWQDFGGTSAAAPLWAAFSALANASSACRGLTLGFVNPALYRIAGSGYGTSFHDITAADPYSPGEPNNNTDYASSNSLNPHGLYPLATGYDMATGLGSPVVPRLAASLCALRAPVYSVSVANPGQQTTTINTPVSLQLHATDSGNATLRYAASGLPAGLSIAPSTGLITGTPTSAGSGTVTVTATDAFANSALTQFGWMVVTPGAPIGSGFKLGGVGSGSARLHASFVAGSYAPALHSIRISLPAGLSFVRRARGIGVTAAGRRISFAASGGGGSLTLSFTPARTAVSITIAKPAIVVSSGLGKRVERRKVKHLSLRFLITDAAGHTTSLARSLKL